MRHVHGAPIALMVVATLAVATPVPAGQVVKHSGSIVSVDQAASTLTLAEVGPWQVRYGQTVVTHRTIAVTPSTGVAVAKRAAQGASGFAGDFVEAAADRSTVSAGDFVTIECEQDGMRLVARKITVVSLQAP